jgi:hypothetical protein
MSKAKIYAAIIYGIVGFVMGAVCAVIYNIVASKIGGVELTLK